MNRGYISISRPRRGGGYACSALARIASPRTGTSAIGEAPGCWSPPLRFISRAVSSRSTGHDGFSSSTCKTDGQMMFTELRCPGCPRHQPGHPLALVTSFVRLSYTLLLSVEPVFCRKAIASCTCVSLGMMPR